MSGPIRLRFPSPTKKPGKIISPPSSEYLKVMNQGLDSQGFHMTQEKKRSPGPGTQHQPGTSLLWLLGTLMLSSSFSRCNSCFSSSATRIMFSFSRSRSFSVSCRMGRVGSGLALEPGHSAQPKLSSQDPSPKGNLGWWLPSIVPMRPGSDTM